MTSETRTQPFSMSPVSPVSPVDIEPRQYRRGSMVDDAMAEPFMRVGRRGSDGSDGSLSPIEKRDRRMSKEWDASKTPPSRFQKQEGSIFATPSSRDGHVARNKIHGFKEKVKELSGKK
ncbi:uncharacterized protein H6S33_001286 [Morchella sextelata]|uniref:uncharacterized protein n=1 Tax=Morchella sextelata TaxID=1174677 RepID=UPI001D03BA5B|nr:uncharacterized protein H6S33_001286 [Morchella sextelata]KAH0609058.1 hypothetical protein H6S33_001286 [Morchella sextelata]